jgi:hypothetical protein
LISQKKIHPSKRVNAFTLVGESPFGKGESPSKRVNHLFERLMVKKGAIEKGSMKGE